MIELSSALETPRLKRKLGVRSYTAVRQKKKESQIEKDKNKKKKTKEEEFH